MAIYCFEKAGFEKLIQTKLHNKYSHVAERKKYWKCIKVAYTLLTGKLFDDCLQKRMQESLKKYPFWQLYLNHSRIVKIKWPVFTKIVILSLF